MKGFLLLCSTALLLTLIQDVPLCTGAADKKKASERTCEEMVADLTKRQIASVGTCTKDLKLKDDKEKAAKVNCILKCALRKEKLLNKEGKAPKDLLDKYLEKECPPKLKPKAKELLGKCLDTKTAGFKDDEEDCKSYEPFIKCASAAMGVLCKE